MEKRLYNLVAHELPSKLVLCPTNRAALVPGTLKADPEAHSGGEETKAKMRGKFRASYYDIFSRVYDTFVALHSLDSGAKLRDFLADNVALHKGDRVLDICTGTGALLNSLRSRVASSGAIWGVDFSKGMLRQANQKYDAISNICLIQANVVHLPFKRNVFDAVTCSHAFYELTGETAHRCLQEVVRVLRNDNGRFVMMEHDVPKNFFVRILFYLRILSMGSKKALEILNNEERLFKNYFGSVKKIKTEKGRSKIFIGRTESSIT